MASKRVLLSVAVAAFVVVAAVAQEQASVPTPRIWIGYYGELGTHPGIAAGAQFAVVDTGWYEFSVGPVVGVYLHPRNHVGLFLDVELENRLVLPSGFFFSVGASAGYYHTWLAGEVYVRDAAGEITETGDWGRPYLKTGGSVGLGWDLAQVGAAPLSVFTRLDLFAQYPFNDAILPHAAILAGAAYQTGGAR